MNCYLRSYKARRSSPACTHTHVRTHSLARVETALDKRQLRPFVDLEEWLGLERSCRTTQACGAASKPRARTERGNKRTLSPGHSLACTSACRRGDVTGAPVGERRRQRGRQAPCGVCDAHIPSPIAAGSKCTLKVLFHSKYHHPLLHLLLPAAAERGLVQSALPSLEARGAAAPLQLAGLPSHTSASHHARDSGGEGPRGCPGD